MSKKSPSQKGKHARRKGHQFERDIANALRVVFPNARRQLEYHQDDAKGVDIQGTGNYYFQCKRFKAYAPLSAITEIQCEPSFGDVPVLVTAGDNKPALACLPFEELVRLLRIDAGFDRKIKHRG